MSRALYRWLVWLHPPAFRRQFAGEMLWVFDEAAGSAGTVPLFADGLLSLARQWVIRKGTWKVAVAGVGGLLHIALVMSMLAAELSRTWTSLHPALAHDPPSVRASAYPRDTAPE